jgi:hypothetical protein
MLTSDGATQLIGTLSSVPFLHTVGRSGPAADRLTHKVPSAINILIFTTPAPPRAASSISHNS